MRPFKKEYPRILNLLTGERANRQRAQPIFVRCLFETAIGLICLLVFGAFSVNAEKSTELYIPIGQSPGLSGEYTVLGKIDQVNIQNRTVKMSGASGSYTVKLTERTFIYLDRSKLQRSNTYATLAECKGGDTVQVKFEDNSRNKPIEWIKVEKSQ